MGSDIRSDIKQAVLDFDSMKNALNVLGLNITDNPTSEYDDAVLTLKNKVDQVDSLIETIAQNDVDFENIYNAIVTKGQLPVKDDRGTYDDAILAIETGGGIALHNLAYFFYNGAREPDYYWDLVNETVNNMYHMLDTATLTAGGRYMFDLMGCVDSESAKYVLYNTKMSANGVVDLVFRVGAEKTLLDYLIYGASNQRSATKLYNVSFTEDSDASAIKSLQYWLYNYTFNNVDLSKLAGTQLETLANAFRNTDIVGAVDFNVFDTSNISSFANCFTNYNASRGLETLDISGWSFENASNITGMCSGCGCKSILLPTTPLVDCIKTDAFVECGNLEKLHLNVKDTLTKECLNLTTFYKDYELTEITSDEDWTICSLDNESMFNGCTKLIKLPTIHYYHVGTDISTRTKMLYKLFKGATAIEEINIYIEDAPNLTTVKAQSALEAFYNDAKLKALKGNLDFSRFNVLTNTFYGCTSLVTVETKGGIGTDPVVTTSSITVDFSASEVFDISSYINSLASNDTGLTRTIKLNSVVYSALTEDTIALATTKNYTLASA